MGLRAPFQVENCKESQRRLYDFAKVAKEHGWPDRRIRVIDEDQGRSGSTPTTRSGFDLLLTALARREVGMVLSLEASRLARNSPDWHTLIYLARHTDTLIADETGIYEPALATDRLLLGLRGQMSEMELDAAIHRMDGQAEGNECQNMGARRIDEQAAALFLEVVRECGDEVATLAETTIRHEGAQAHQTWKLRVERAEQEARRAERQFHAVEPENRLVARTLEARWNASLQRCAVFYRCQSIQVQSVHTRCNAAATFHFLYIRHRQGRPRAHMNTWQQCLLVAMLQCVRGFLLTILGMLDQSPPLKEFLDTPVQLLGQLTKSRPIHIASLVKAQRTHRVSFIHAVL